MNASSNIAPKIVWTDKTYYLTDICRLCGSSGDQVNYLLSLTEPEVNGTSNVDTLLEKIKRLIPLSIEENDKKPKQICQNCVTKLSEYDDFMSMCLGVDINFNNIINNLAGKFEGDESHGDKCMFLIGDKNNRDLIYSQPENNIILVNKADNVLSQPTQDLYLMVELNYKDIQQGVVTIPQMFKYNDDVLLDHSKSLNNTTDVQTTILNNVMEENVSPTNVQSEQPSSELPVKGTTEGKKEKAQKFQCNICNKTLARKSNLTTHIALHSKVRPHKCEDCGKRFVIPWDLSIHRHIHSGTYTCDFCKKPFVTKSKLERHRRSHTGEKEHSCSVCNKKFAEKNNMIAHMSIHTGIRPFSCSICKKSFRIQSHLSDHSKVHSSSTPYQCLTCGKCFKWKSNLKDHNKYHSGEKFKCITCQKEFKIRADYYRHRKECKEEQESRTCCFCNNTFSEKNILLDHLKTDHKNETIYQCELCEKVFRTLQLLKFHIGINNCMNKSDVFRCDLCPMVFLKKSNFLSHFKTHENISSINC